jgi:hypothetical protein
MRAHCLREHEGSSGHATFEQIALSAPECLEIGEGEAETVNVTVGSSRSLIVIGVEVTVSSDETA